MAPAATTDKAVTRAATASPYQLDGEKTLKASRALLKYVAGKKSESDNAKPNLLEDKEDAADAAKAIWLVLATKKYISDSKTLKPSRVPLAHPLQTTADTTACLIVKDPQRHYKDFVAAANLSSTVTKVVGISKLRAKFKTFEQRRQLRDSHDLFLADDRIITMLPKILGSVFYKKTSKIPIPVSLSGNDSPSRLAGEVDKAFGATYLHLSAAASTSIRVGLTSFTPEQLAENIQKVVDTLVEKKIPGGWKAIRSLQIKTSESTTLPIWMADDLYEETDILNPGEEEERKKFLEDKDKERKERKAVKKEKRKSLSRDGNKEDLPVAKKQKVSEDKVEAIVVEETEEASMEDVPEEVEPEVETPKPAKKDSKKHKADEPSEPVAPKVEKPKKRKSDAAETIAAEPAKEKKAKKAKLEKTVAKTVPEVKVKKAEKEKKADEEEKEEKEGEKEEKKVEKKEVKKTEKKTEKKAEKTEKKTEKKEEKKEEKEEKKTKPEKKAVAKKVPEVKEKKKKIVQRRSC
ncbi:proteasome-interacting protein cic1 [Rhizina undulata]